MGKSLMDYVRIIIYITLKCHCYLQIKPHTDNNVAK